MKKGLQSVCALMLTTSVLLATLTACGKKPEFNGGSANNALSDNQFTQNTTIANSNGDTNSDSNLNSDSNGNSSSGGSYSSGGNSSSGGYSGGSYSGGSGNSSSGGNSSGKTPSVSPSTGKTDIEESTSATERTTRTPTHNDVDVEKVLNSAKLNPMRTGDADLEQRVDEVLAQVTTPKMSTYEKVRAIYDYLVRSNTYIIKMAPRATEKTYISPYDSDVVSRAKTILKNKRGNCIDFSAAFMVLTRRIGLDCYLVTGQILNKYGDKSLHGWNIIRINGKDYGFDPEGDFRYSDSGKSETKYTIFCMDDPVKFNANYTKIAVASFMKFKTL
ncbi:MAG: hypothetical protein MJ168_06190 [Clostridia bacterium]|nr:hypothetical protein [Clostridia bacterium]